MLSRQSGATKKYILDEIEELIWVNVSAQRTQSLRICPMSALCPEPDFADMFDLGQRADVCWPACLVQACHLQSAIQCHLTQFQLSRLCRIGMRSQPAGGQLRLNPDGGAYPFRVQPTDAPAFARLIPSARMRCSRVV